MPSQTPANGETKSHVYVRSEDNGWVPAIQLKSTGDQATVVVPVFKNEQELMSSGGTQKYYDNQVIDLTQYPNKVLPMQNVDSDGKLEDYKDMVSLPFLHEAAILYNLKNRHMNEKPYTRTGDIVIAVNPYQWYDNLYTEQKRAHYANRLVWEPSDRDPRGTLDPHVYEVSALAYKGLAFEGVDQSILVSGESGAGKTETVKICLDHVASVQRGPTPEYSSTTLDPHVQLVLDANPLLEAFGNAKTLRNDNSSRFGKYLQLQFDKNGSSNSAARCGLAGSKTEVYLLEKNRVVGHNPQERNFHIFYQLLAAPEAEKVRFWKGLKGANNESFSYIGHTNTTSIEGISDANRFRDTLQALATVGVVDDKLDNLVRALCIVLQLGNLRFAPHSGDSDKSNVATTTDLCALAGLMDVSEKDLTLAFTERTFETKGDSHKVPLNAAAAHEACDALAKEAYQKAFLWLVNTINNATQAPEIEDQKYGIIGLLDIFGFETFEVNRFEQLCINYANEKLQQKFTEDIFRNVQAEYKAEGIDLADIWFDDNTDVLDLIEGRTGLLAMLNEECVRPKGNDQDFVQKALHENKASPCLVVNKFDRMSFGIRHFAGSVLYDAEGFLGKNLDTLPTDLQLCTEKCSNTIINTARLDARGEGSNSSTRGAPKKSESNIAAKTVWSKYRTHLTSLMTDLRKTRSRYIRCIKPNAQKAPILMEHNTVVDQLRCAGVVAGVTISRSVFPNQLDNRVVLSRYSNMWDKKRYPSKKTSDMSPEERRAEDCKALMTCALTTKEVTQNNRPMKAFAVGKTRTYFRSGALEWLENSRMSGLDAQAKTIQRAARGFLARKRVHNFEERKVKEAAKRQAAAQAKIEAKKAHKNQLEQEAVERDRVRKQETRSMDDELARLTTALGQADKDCDKTLEEVEEVRQKSIRENEQLEKDVEDFKAKNSGNAQVELKQQEKRLDEAKKLIAYLKKENRKARLNYDKLFEKAKTTRDNAKSLIEANQNAGDVFEDLDDEAMSVHRKHDNLMEQLDTEKKENKRLVKACRKMQDEYIAVAEARLDLQKAMATSLSYIQEDCTDPQIVEDTVIIALECETEAKSQMAALDAMDELDLVDTDVSDTESQENSQSQLAY